MCENMIICVKYAKCVKIWPFDTLCSVSEVLCSFSDGQLNLAFVLPLVKAKGRRTLSMLVSHLKQRETHSKYVCLSSNTKGDTCYGGASPFYLTAQKKYQQHILHGILLAPANA
jgi:hypothetical protein